MRGLETGADDYLGKPCEPRELALRIASILRRAAPRAIAGPPVSVRFGDFSFDLGRGELRQRDEIVRLTDRERDLLRLLAENAGETVARETLAGSGVAANERALPRGASFHRDPPPTAPAPQAHVSSIDAKAVQGSGSENRARQRNFRRS